MITRHVKHHFFVSFWLGFFPNFFFRGLIWFYFFQFPGGLPHGMPGLPPAGPPRLDLPASLGGSLPPPRGSDPLMSLGPSAPSSGAPLRAPSVNDKVIYIMGGLFRQKDNLYYYMPWGLSYCTIGCVLQKSHVRFFKWFVTFWKRNYILYLKFRVAMARIWNLELESTKPVKGSKKNSIIYKANITSK